ncbi:L-aspartate oxidase [Haloechinothrix sp. LS1_15]|uniref:L-aspartate oxidase n=1 Tax=Haloechinothrix sp. LS1_15 TaxID=2652248 RepID=UPI0029477534|nr:L-aspartate oxidase [Haloechinothrix sp. LS1_15]MDV6012697.1 L-aspartate oxidase [Haloechinothrix sp. LS1_15]
MSVPPTPVNDGQSKTPHEAVWEADADLVVIGTGVAGLSAALRAHELGLRTLVLTKATVTDSNTRWAQGGLAVVLGGRDGDTGATPDSVERHVADTVAAGVGLCEASAVRSVISGGAAAVERLRARGAVFDTASGDRHTGSRSALARTREGGHSAFRVIHAGGDATGAEVQRALVEDAARTGVPVLERHIAADAMLDQSGAIAGVCVLDHRGRRGVVRAQAALVATGGFGQLYLASSNPEIATGDGLALAMRAGAAAADLEFVQFHPTVLYTPGATGRCPLVTEAVRGEGGVLVDVTGHRVMARAHPQADLAPRDVVSATITRHLARAPGGVDDHVFLDATGIRDFPRRFPTVHAACRAAGVDPVREPIPVAPAAHFACGGVVATPQGRTEVPGLYAAGEVARTGMHGANRLASNSLLEGLVVGERAAEAVAADRATARRGHAGPAVPSRTSQASLPEVPVTRMDRAALQRAMSRYAAIGRDDAGLDALAGTIESARVPSGWHSHRDVEDAALTLVARALVAAAVARTESRGSHVRTDRAGRDDARWRYSQCVRLTREGTPEVTGPVSAIGVAA